MEQNSQRTSAVTGRKSPKDSCGYIYIYIYAVTAAGIYLGILCDMHSLMPVGFFMYLSMNDLLPGCLFAVVVI